MTIGNGEDRKSYVTILGQQLSFGIRETLKKVPNPPATPSRLLDGTVYMPWQSKYHDEPSGHLSFVTRNSWGHAVDKSWVESKARPLEERLSDFIVSLVAIAQEAVESAKRREQEVRAWREAEELRRAAEERRRAEARRVQALRQQSARWEISRRLREYLTAVRAVAESQPGALQADSDLSNWLAWAEGYARSIDPLQQSLHKLLNVAESSHETD